MVVIRGMNVFPSAIEQTLRDARDGVGEFRITFYTEPGAMDEVKLEVELAHAARGARDPGAAAPAARAARAGRAGQARDPARTEGKARRVADLRPVATRAAR